MFNFPLTKNSQQRKTARHRKTRMKNNIVSIGSYVWLLLLDFAKTEIAVEVLYVRSSGTVSRELQWGKRVYTGLTSYG